MNFIQPADRSQIEMVCLDDRIPSDHPVRVIDEIVDRLVAANQSLLLPPPEEMPTTGAPPYAPETMLKLYFYGYFNHIYASRKLETECLRNTELQWLLGSLAPDHWTIATYRTAHAAELALMYRKFQEFLRDAGYIKGRRVAVDGSKFKANARRTMVSVDSLAQEIEGAEHELQHYLAVLSVNDAHEDIQEYLVTPADSSEKQQEKLRAAIATLSARVEHLKEQQVVAEGKKKSGHNFLSPADPDANLMRTTDGKLPAYNVQSVVDADTHMIAVVDVSTEEADRHLLAPMLDILNEELGLRPEDTIADAGYYAPDDIERIEQETGTTCYVPPNGKGNKEPSVVGFTYDPEFDQYRCSQGRPLVLITKNKRKRNSLVNVYRGTECTGCPVKEHCTTSRSGRIIHRYHNHDWRDRFKERMASPVAKGLVKLRKAVVEHPFGTIKCWAGTIPLLLRGVKKVTTEIKLFVTAYNFRRLLTLQPIESILDQVKGAQWALSSSAG